MGSFRGDFYPFSVPAINLVHGPSSIVRSGRLLAGTVAAGFLNCRKIQITVFIFQNRSKILIVGMRRDASLR
jgi:hypothetical protein